MNKGQTNLYSFPQHYNLNDQIFYIRRLKFPAAVCAVLAIMSCIYSFMIYSTDHLLEYLLMGINNILIVVSCGIAIYWSATFQIEVEENYTPSANHNYLPYIHCLFSQVTCAIEFGLLMSLVQYKSYTLLPWLAMIQIVIMFLQLYGVFVGHVYNHRREFGVQRLVVYSTATINLGILLFACYNLKELIMQLNYQMFTLRDQYIALKSVEFSLIFIGGITLLVVFLNWRRIRIYFITISFILMTAAILLAVSNGMLVREAQFLHKDLALSNGCRNAMQTIGQDSLKELGCPIKYLQLENSPFLTCSQEQQTYMWENNSNQLACINEECCSKLKPWLIQPITQLTVWINLIVAIAILQTFNTMILSNETYRQNRMNFVGDILMLIITVCIVIMAIVLYQVSPPPPVQVQHAIVKQDQILAQITILPTPSYDNFKLQKRLIGFQNLQTCELAQNIILPKISYEEPPHVTNPGMILAIQGTFGKFVVLDDFNSKDLSILTTKEAVSKIFTEEIPAGVIHDEIIVQGTLSMVNIFMSQSLHFCSSSPLNSNFNIVQSIIEMPKPTRLLAIAETAQNQITTSVKYYTVTGIVKSSVTTEILPFAEAFLYQGGFQYTSCQVITSLKPHYLRSTADSDGKITFSNLSFGTVYTVLVKMKGFKNGCGSIDLTSDKPITQIHINLSPMIEKYSMSVILEWTSDTLDLDLYGEYTVRGHKCITGAISKDCGGMHLQQLNQKSQHSEILSIASMEPFKYTFFVKRFLSRDDAMKRLELNNPNMNTELFTADPTVTVYVNEIDYPIIQYRLPSFTNQNDKALLDLTWLVFEVDAYAGDGPITLQKYWSDISNEEVHNKKAANKQVWP